MKTVEMIIEIHEKVNEIRTHQVRNDEQIKNLEIDVKEHDKSIEKLKGDSFKVKGAGLLIVFLATISKAWESMFG